ncbi:MAG: alanine racemase [Candidatus Omnitrophica bacterium]|nr:alanine racemase [Candidatus Omnitrophota bacterium]
MRFYRPTWAEIDLESLAHNYKQIKKLLKPKTKVMVTIKADAYGHGLIPVAKKLLRCKVDYFGVASIDEGIRLRKENIKVPILILGLILKKDIGPLFRYNLTPTVCDQDLALCLNRKAARLRKPIKVHIKIDTGMGRIGILSTNSENIVKKINSLEFIRIEGIFTHLAAADVNRKLTLQQLGVFNNLVLQLNKSGIEITLIHAANSIAVLNFKKSHFNLVRPGLVIYGLYPKKNLKIKLKSVLNLKTRIIYVKRVPAGYGISYGHDYVTRRGTNIVTLPIGYGDGYPRNLSNCAPILIRGKRFKISGRICMDQLMVDVGNTPVKIGEEAVLIGVQRGNKISAEELAELAKTIPYEIVCGLGGRIPRVYL